MADTDNKTSVEDYIKAHPEEFKRVMLMSGDLAVRAVYADQLASLHDIHTKGCAKGSHNPSTHEPFASCTCGGARAHVVKLLQAQNAIRWQEMEALAEGTDNQRERYRDGLLPEDELLTIARAILFKGFGGLDIKRWATGHDRAKMLADLKHKPEDHTLYPDDLEFEVAETAELDAKEYDRLKQLRGAAEAAQVHPWLVRFETKVRVETSTHWVTCKVCGAELCRTSVKVTIPWAGRQLVREYAL